MKYHLESCQELSPVHHRQNHLFQNRDTVINARTVPVSNGKIGIDNPFDESNIPELVTFIVYELLLFGTLRYKCVKNVTIRYSFNNSNPWHG
jgi:hypothetical protein